MPDQQARQAQFERLQTLLAELFQFDRADLDFGIYRIMNARREEVARFLEHDLLPQVRAVLGQYQSTEQAGVEAEMDRLRRTLNDAGVPYDTSSRYQQLQAKLAGTASLDDLERQVFSDLFTFFRRYYQDGDFISLRRYKPGVYAIPYEGEEVKLHWANADQYYVKSSENFRDYRVRLPDGRHVHFRLVAAGTERDNNKAAEGRERRFVLREDDAVTDEDGELQLHFEYRVHPDNQKALNAAAVETILALPEVAAWRDALATAAPTAAATDRTLLAKHLADYTAKNSFDYFIHKDLGGFLRRELDFFLKNEVLHLDDLDTPDERRVEQYLARLRAIKQIGLKIVAFLAQTEEFQKRLWLKKKFVVRTDYCLTLDRVPEALYEQIVANEAQWAEWERLFAISDLPNAADRAAVLRDQPYLVVDTRFFDACFREALLASFDDLDAETDGVLINGDNFQALTLLQQRFAEQVKCIYIDPPYNTGDDGFLYKDNYVHSSWLSMMTDRLLEARIAFSNDGVLIVSIGREELFHLQVLCDQTLGAENRIADLVWEKGRKNDAKYFSLGHDYLLVYANDADHLRSKKTIWREEKPGAHEILAEYRRLLHEYENDYETIRTKLLEFYRTLPMGHPALKHRRYNRIDGNGVWRDDNMSWPGGDGPRYDVIHPKTGLPCKVPDGGWRFSTHEKFNLYQDHGFIEFREDHTEPPMLKRYLNYVPTDFDPDARRRSTSASTEGEQDANVQVMPSVFYKNQQPTVVELRNILGHNAFSNPKDPEVLGRLIQYVSGTNDITLDYFAGSGTTGHAVIQLNREDGGKRKYILVEMGEYFDSVLKPRMLKAIYSKDWKQGNPISREGIGQLVKILRLESYDDTLNNIALRERPEAQQRLLDADPALREDFLISYALDLDTAGSPSLLNLDAFETPFDYRLTVTLGGEPAPVAVDLPETFNYLLGLRVERWSFPNGMKVVEGRDTEGRRSLIVWRNLRDPQHDNAALDTWFSEAGYLDRPLERAIERVYVNGDSTLAALRPDDATWTAIATEEAFTRLMFAGADPIAGGFR